MPEARAPGRRSASRWLPVSVAVLTLLVLVWSAALIGALWADLAPAEREALGRLLQPRAGLVMLFALLLPLLLWLAVRPWIAAWPRAAERLREEVAVVSTAHAGHRVRATGARELRELALAIDDLAQAHAALERDVQTRIEAAGAALAEETRRLAALMSELTLGVLVCNRDGRVLLYNARASALLDNADGVRAGAGVAPLGLGRMVQTLLDPNALEHAWQHVRRRIDVGDSHAVAHFVTSRQGRGAVAAKAATEAATEAERGPLLRVQMVPTLDDGGLPGGYVLIIDDITRSVQEQSRREVLLQQLTEGTRSALGNLRAAAQALHQYPAMDAARRTRFTDIVHEEAERLAGQLGAALREPGGPPATAWPLEHVQAADLVFALRRSLRAGPGIECRFEGAGGDSWLLVDSHAIVQLLSNLAGRLHAELGVHEVTIEVTGGPEGKRLDICWQGAPLEPGVLGAWEHAPLAAGMAQHAARLRDVLDRHGAELWSQSAGDATDRHCLCVQFGADTRDGAPGAAAPRPARGRPIAYDFDLFHQAGQNAVLDETPLAALSYTVFDTETTGLRPSEGDEIIAIGAVRIVNARLLEGERFDRRVRPRRAVRASAQAVHGISSASLVGEPTLEQVLPPFAGFCDDTVLVAHNAAFDMRFLELARVRTGVRFDQPVLDTMLLSAVLQPGHRGDEHHLEQIAARLGVPVQARHEALGDALTTARVLLKLVPLLAERGIVTLAQARAASQRVAAAHESY